uniref:Transmembrane protein n=1 Tax=Toxocara canis TaxID=6265 RepID=A0A183U2R0_TOXCA
LDERPLGSSLAETERSTRHGSHDLLNSRVHSDRRTRKQFTFCLFACFLQLSIALGLLAFGGFRFRRIFEVPCYFYREDKGDGKREWGEGENKFSLTFQRSSRFADFDNPQGKEVSNESASLASILSGSSWFVPSLLHIIAAITASWPILPNFSSTLQTLYIIFSSFAIIFWFNGIFTTAFELNVYYVQINEYQNTIQWMCYLCSFTFRTLVVLFILASINVLIVPTLGIVYAAFEHTSSAPQKRSLFHSIATLFSILFSATPLFLAVPCLFFTAQNLRQW